MGSRTTREIGQQAELVARQHLKQGGLRWVASNVGFRGGEIDLIMVDAEVLVFIEVRYRQSGSFTHPFLTVDRRKQQKIIRTAAMFAARHRHYASNVMRFDIVAITGSGFSHIEWLKAAFQPNNSTL